MIPLHYKRWFLPILVGLLLFGNHYIRDSVGALEKQLESQSNLTVQDYAMLNTFYFFPNIITPLIAGMFTDTLGGVSICFLYSVTVASIGHLLFALGIQFSNKGLIFLGRGIGGSMYEIVDAMMPISYLGPLFAKEFQIVVGFMQIFIRMGSVVNFIVSPYIYLHYNMKLAFWVAAIIGMASVPLFLMARTIEFEYLQYIKENNTDRDDKMVTGNTKNQNDDGLCDIEMSRLEGSQSDMIENGGGQFCIVSSDDTDEPKECEDYTPISRSSRQSPTSIAQSVHNPLNKSGDISVENNTSQTSVSTNSTGISMWSRFLQFMPLDKFTVQFYMYMISGSCLYGSIVPFWFIGSRYLQERLAYSVVLADHMVAVPELLVIIVGFPLGVYVGSKQWETRTKLTGLCIATLGMAIAYIILMTTTIVNLSCIPHCHLISVSDKNLSSHDYEVAHSYFIPLLAVILLGTSFAISCQLFWGSITEVCGVEYMTPATGLVSCAVNLLPALVPPILAYFNNDNKSSQVDMIALIIMAIMSSLFALLAICPMYAECVVYPLRCVVHICSYQSTSSAHSIVLHTNKNEVILKYEKLSIVDDNNERR